MVWLSGLLPYRQVVQVLARVGHRQLPGTSVWTQTQYHGKRLRAYVEHQQEYVGVERVTLPPPGQDHKQRKGVSMDGGMVHIRGEGWKEFKVGTVFDVELRLERDPRTRDLVECAHGVHMAYTAVLGSAHALHPDDAAAAQRWFRKRCRDLYKGQIHKITMRLDSAGLEQYSRYFHTHKRRMQYQIFEEEGYPVGSGTVESGIKQFKGRLTGPGMRWSRQSAQQMLVIRSAVMAQDFDILWAAA
jgi:hypothetical protein